MLRAYRTLALPAAILTAIPLLAQQPAAAAPQGPVCDVEQMQPSQLAMASINRSKVVGAKTPDEGMKAVRDGMKNIFDKATAQNTLGRDYLAAQFMLLAIEFGGEVQTRGNLNMPGDKAASLDLMTTADSLLTLVQTAKPACKDEISQWREYKPFANRIQAAYAALAANQLDSAERSAQRAMMMASYTPQPYDVLWRLYQAKGDQDNQIKYLKLAVEKLTTDTANARIRANLLFNLGRVQQEFADKAQGERKAAMWKGAAEAYLQVVTDHPAADETPFAVSGISTRWALTQDSSESIKVLGACRAGIAKIGDIGLAQCGVVATRLQRGAEAADLFQAASAANPYSRDYLYNYAATLFELKKSAEMIPVVSKLLAMDPSNPDNVLLYAYAYKGMADATTDAAQKKALTDSAVAYSTKSDGMKHKLSYTSFDRGKETTSLQGEIENRDKAPKSFTVEFEFVDKAGATVEKKSVTVGPVAPNASTPFTVEIAKGGVAGVKYAAIP